MAPWIKRSASGSTEFQAVATQNKFKRKMLKNAGSISSQCSTRIQSDKLKLLPV